MHKVMFKQHFKEHAGSYSSNVASDLFIVVLLKLSHSLARNKGHNEYLLTWLIKGFRKCNLWVGEDSIELLQIFLFLSKIKLLEQFLTEWVLINGDFKKQCEQWQEPAHCKYYCDVLLNVLLNVGVPHFDCDLLASKYCLVDLTDRSWSNWHRVDFIEEYFRWLLINSAEYLFCLLVGVFWWERS